MENLNLIEEQETEGGNKRRSDVLLRKGFAHEFNGSHRGQCTGGNWFTPCARGRSAVGAICIRSFARRLNAGRDAVDDRWPG